MHAARSRDEAEAEAAYDVLEAAEAAEMQYKNAKCAAFEASL